MANYFDLHTDILAKINGYIIEYRNGVVLPFFKTWKEHYIIAKYDNDSDDSDDSDDSGYIDDSSYIDYSSYSD